MYPYPLVTSQVIDMYSTSDELMRQPIYVIGYYMLRRSTSVRGKNRFPTHAVIAPSSGINMADQIQMVGRVWGRGRDILDGHLVIVLMMKADFDVIRVYRKFITEMLRYDLILVIPSFRILQEPCVSRHENEDERELLEWTTREFPEEVTQRMSSTPRRFVNKSTNEFMKGHVPKETTPKKTSKKPRVIRRVLCFQLHPL